MYEYVQSKKSQQKPESVKYQKREIDQTLTRSSCFSSSSLPSTISLAGTNGSLRGLQENIVDVAVVVAGEVVEEDAMWGRPKQIQLRASGFINEKISHQLTRGDAYWNDFESEYRT